MEIIKIATETAECWMLKVDVDVAAGDNDVVMALVIVIFVAVDIVCWMIISTTTYARF